MSTGRPMISDVSTAVYRFPTLTPEADGTLAWEATTAVVVHVRAGGCTGLGWTYSSAAAATVVHDELRDELVGRDPLDIGGAWSAMHRASRNLGSKGLVMQAISAADIALWDLKARLLDRPLTDLLGTSRVDVPIYGSGGFTTLTEEELAEQVESWRRIGCRAMKIKIGESWGTEIARDLQRVHRLRELAGPGVELMVDANGGYTASQARRVGAVLDELGVVWFEEPVSSDDTAGLALVRGAVRCDVAAGEYVSDGYDAARLAPVVDCLQLDATRCGGYTGWLRCAAIAAAHNLQVSAHCAPALHAPVAAAIPTLRHLEYFIDHARLEPLLVDNAPTFHEGCLLLDSRHQGHGMVIADSARTYAVRS